MTQTPVIGVNLRFGHPGKLWSEAFNVIWLEWKNEKMSFVSILRHDTGAYLSPSQGILRKET